MCEKKIIYLLYKNTNKKKMNIYKKHKAKILFEEKKNCSTINDDDDDYWY